MKTRKIGPFEISHYNIILCKVYFKHTQTQTTNKKTIMFSFESMNHRDKNQP